MANYSYVAIDPRGLEARGVLEVTNQSEAIRRVREMGLFPTKIKETSATQLLQLFSREIPAVRKRQVFPRPNRRIRAVSLMIFTRQLSTMIGAGMPLIRSLRILAEQNDSKSITAIITSLAAEIENGSSFSEALASHPRTFNSLYVNLVRAGEAGGALEATLGRLTEFLEKGATLRGKLKAAMVYPASVIVVAAGVMGVLLAFVVPKFQEVFEGLLGTASLPAFTRFVFGVSKVLVHHLPAIALVSFFAVLISIVLSKTERGRWFIDQIEAGDAFAGAIVSESGNFQVRPYAWNARRQWRADFAGSDYRAANNR